nr:hypothetical protein [Gammaproteobacteria bacterium]
MSTVQVPVDSLEDTKERTAVIFPDYVMMGAPFRARGFFYTRGGDTLAAWSLINLLRIFSRITSKLSFQARPQRRDSPVPRRRLDNNDQAKAALGPIDASVHTPLNPQIPGAPDAKVPVSVESINGFIEFARETLDKDAGLKQVFVHLASTVHPLA